MAVRKPWRPARRRTGNWRCRSCCAKRATGRRGQSSIRVRGLPSGKSRLNRLRSNSETVWAGEPLNDFRGVRQASVCKAGLSLEMGKKEPRPKPGPPTLANRQWEGGTDDCQAPKSERATCVGAARSVLSLESCCMSATRCSSSDRGHDLLRTVDRVAMDEDISGIRIDHQLELAPARDLGAAALGSPFARGSGTTGA